MSRQILKYLNTPNILQKATYKHFVVSESLANIERECARYCYVPRIPPRKVTVVGAGSDVGCITSLFLKQQKVIKTLALYDDDPDHCVVGMATDLAHIDTSTEVQAFRGRAFLKTALHDTDVVLICGGRCACCESDRELFFRNMRQVRTVTVACAQFCPHAVIAIQTPPVDCNFALCVHTLKLAGVYDKRKVLGMNAINSMRANQLFSAMTGSDPSKNHIPVVCGTGKCTRVPVFSIAKAGNIPQAQVECLTRLVREADDIVCRVNSCHQQAHLSLGFSTARFVTSIMTGLHERPTFIDSALVEQEDPSRCYGLSVCASPVTVGSSGVVGYAVPKLSEVESQILEDSKCDLEDMLNLGRCYAVGDEYCLHPDKVCPSPLCFPCPTCESCQSERKRLQTFP